MYPYVAKKKRKVDSEYKSERITIQVTPAQKSALICNAKSNDLTLTQYMLWASLDRLGDDVSLDARAFFDRLRNGAGGVPASE